VRLKNFGTEGIYFDALIALEDYQTSFAGRALSVSNFNAKRGFMVRSEGGRICCNSKNLSELGNR
jgi:hypothetical protein